MSMNKLDLKKSIQKIPGPLHPATWGGSRPFQSPRWPDRASWPTNNSVLGLREKQHLGW